MVLSISWHICVYIVDDLFCVSRSQLQHHSYYTAIKLNCSVRDGECLFQLNSTGSSLVKGLVLHS